MFSPRRRGMATLSFSVPDEIRKAFQETFANENQSAIIARLMMEAVEDRKRQERQAAAIDALLDLRREERPTSDKEIARARRAGRP
jgi:predicted transcriptional regulator